MKSEKTVRYAISNSPHGLTITKSGSWYRWKFTCTDWVHDEKAPFGATLSQVEEIARTWLEWLVEWNSFPGEHPKEVARKVLDMMDADEFELVGD
jgi:hypothetical protein